MICSLGSVGLWCIMHGSCLIHSMKVPICRNNACAQKLNSCCNHDMLIGFSWVVVHFVLQLAGAQHEGASVQRRRKGTATEHILQP